ncbi:MAG: hypothetical protein Kow006_10560 [Gammaproteobacteria bacterium]
MTTITLHRIHARVSATAAARAAAKWMGRVVTTGWQQLELWQERANQRHRLLELDDRLLKDIGISRAEAEREARKPFWKP